ncbi:MULTISPECIES: CaiB/BaiF CoA-transferase family protein [unclassified Arthrobacter]|uniref:CaiB/BaiF CoA transferase family protein n=1 Tax=unclassified Arthrobacter TaxID=235627 RepID=UPI001CFFBF83|nr:MULTISPECIES: CaiB/BaiF CoA-transferase family protein [unclassified Arthrobacter]MCB5280779.1 Acetyl-CoA:oxalate CoA-transferase [Arthrobacter sp. ES1]WGZ79477.1 CaiB/BaiF CoA-transferase family protein [Arthrobacter sp. EM1]
MRETLDLPLEGIVVLDFSQFLAGPVAALRLADLGARVIKIERPETGDIGRTLAFAGRTADGDTVSFHAMNRNKESYTADLKDSTDLAVVRKLITQADVIIQNFRPGVMERIGLDYESVSELNPRIVYASATGYGNHGPWKDRPGQDLLAQSISGIPWLSGSSEDGPVPVGISIADHLMSCHIAQGVTALLLRRERTGRGGHVETSLLEGLLDLQFELLSTHLNDSTVTVERRGKNSANAFLAAPYGTYPTKDGFIALAMNPIAKLGALLNVTALEELTDAAAAWQQEPEIAKILAATFLHESTDHWLELLDAADVWCAPVLTLEELVAHDGFAAINMTQQVSRKASVTQSGEDFSLLTTRSPIRVDGQIINCNRPAPKLGQHNETLKGGVL